MLWVFGQSITFKWSHINRKCILCIYLGRKGEEGSCGLPGQDGLPGAPGPPGDQGNVGEQGYAGPQGKNGTRLCGEEKCEMTYRLSCTPPVHTWIHPSLA